MKEPTKENKGTKKRVVHYAIIRLSHIGDIIHTSPLLRVIKDTHKSRGETAKITWIARRDFRPVIEHFSDVDTILDTTLTGPPLWKKLAHLLALDIWFTAFFKVRRQRFDVIIDSHRVFTSALLTFCMKGEKKISFDHFPDKGPDLTFFFYRYRVSSTSVNTMDRTLSLLQPVFGDHFEEAVKQTFCSRSNPILRLSFAPNSLERVDRFLHENNLRQVILLAPWGTGFSSLSRNRDIGDKLLTRVMAHLQSRYHTPSILLCSKNHRSEAEKVVAAHAGKVILAPETSLQDMMAFLSKADLVVSIDTGPAHIASLLAKRVLTFWGPTQRNLQSPAFSRYLRQSDDQTNAAYPPPTSLDHPPPHSTQAIMSPYLCPTLEKQPIRNSYRCLNKKCVNQAQCMAEFSDEAILHALERTENARR